MNRQMCIVLAGLAIGAVDARVAAQLQGKTCLSFALGSSHIPVAQGAFFLGMSVTWTVGDPESWFIDKLQSQSWDLVGINYNLQFQDKQLIADLLEAHVAGGGKLIVNYPQLDEWPEVWNLLGVTPVNDWNKPKKIIIPKPGNPLYPNGTTAGEPVIDEWPDNGDDLMLHSGSGTVAVVKSQEQPVATAIDPTRTIFTNAFDWDSHSTNSIYARRQIEYLFSCKADMTGDGMLDIFDYLEFVNLFNIHDHEANVNFDGSLDLFDFLEFINLFNQGC